MGADCCASRDKVSYGSTNITRKDTVGSSKKSQEAIKALKDKTRKMEKFLAQVIQGGTPWTDPEFPPELKSLYNSKIDKVDQAKFKAYGWKRMTEIYDKPSVFYGGIEPNDIN